MHLTITSPIQRWQIRSPELIIEETQIGNSSAGEIVLGSVSEILRLPKQMRDLEPAMERKAPARSEQITHLLHSLRLGSRQAESRLIALVYPNLRRLAGHFMRGERPGHTLQPTALVNEVYLRLVGDENPDWRDRSHFFAVASRTMRRILADYARKRYAGKRGGSRQRICLDELVMATDQDLNIILDVDSLLSQLERVDPRLCRVVELRYFGGMTEEESAEVLGISAVTVKRDWRLARAWLYEQLKGPRRKPSGSLTSGRTPTSNA